MLLDNISVSFAHLISICDSSTFIIMHSFPHDGRACHLSIEEVSSFYGGEGFKWRKEMTFRGTMYVDATDNIFHIT